MRFRLRKARLSFLLVLLQFCDTFESRGTLATFNSVEQQLYDHVTNSLFVLAKALLRECRLMSLLCLHPWQLTDEQQQGRVDEGRSGAGHGATASPLGSQGSLEVFGEQEGHETFGETVDEGAPASGSTAASSVTEPVKISVSDTLLADQLNQEADDKVEPETDEQAARRLSFNHPGHRRSKSGSVLSDKHVAKEHSLVRRAATEHPLRKADSASDVSGKALKHRRQDSTTSIDSNGDAASSTYSR